MAALRTMFPLGTIVRTAYYGCMDDYNHTFPARDDTDQHVSDPKFPMVLERI